MTEIKTMGFADLSVNEMEMVEGWFFWPYIIYNLGY